MLLVRIGVNLSAFDRNNAQRPWYSATEKLRALLPLYLHSKNTTNSHTYE
jgi:hypothetical protein